MGVRSNRSIDDFRREPLLEFSWPKNTQGPECVVEWRWNGVEWALTQNGPPEWGKIFERENLTLFRASSPSSSSSSEPRRWLQICLSFLVSRPLIARDTRPPSPPPLSTPRYHGRAGFLVESVAWRRLIKSPKTSLVGSIVHVSFSYRVLRGQESFRKVRCFRFERRSILEGYER